MGDPDSDSVQVTRQCLGCSYRLEGLPENRCPECGRPFDPGDPATYREATARLRLRMTPALLGWLGVALYVVSLFLPELLSFCVDCFFWMAVLPVQIVAGVALALVVVAWGWMDRQRREDGRTWAFCLPAGILLFLSLAIVLPSYLRWLKGVAAIRATQQSLYGGSP